MEYACANTFNLGFDLKELLATWTNLPRSLWKKNLALKKLIVKLEVSESKILNLVSKIVEEYSHGAICRLSSSSAAFLLLCLESSTSKYSEELLSCLLKLVSCINYALACQLNLVSLKAKLTDSIKLKYDYSNLQLLHFFPSVRVDWTVFSKFLGELKGLPQHFQDILPFLRKFLNLHSSSVDLSGIVERLARRNSVLAAAILHELAQCEGFSENINSYAATLEILVPADNETVREYIRNISKITTLTVFLCSNLLKSFSSSSPKAKENISTFLADSLISNKTEENLNQFNFVEIASKELSGSEVTLSSLVQCAALFNSQSSSYSFPAFLKTNLRSNQKLSIKSAILFGIAKSSSFSSLSEDILMELFSVGYLKEAAVTSASSPQSQSFFVCSLVALLNSPEFSVDAKIFNDSILALSKPSGPAIFVEKGWSCMSPVLSDIFISQIVIPVVFEDANRIILSHCISALAWFTINGSKNVQSLIKKHSKPVSIEKVNILSVALDKFLDGAHHVHQVWTLLHLICDAETLKSRPLALLCHDKGKLLGIGAGSWAELVRFACSDRINEYCFMWLSDFIKSGDFDAINEKTPSFYLIETLISLSPSLVTEILRPFETISNSLSDLLNFTPAQWSLLTPRNVIKSASAVGVANKSSSSSKPQTPTSDDAATKARLSKSIGIFKHSITIARAAALALPFNHIFTEIRPLLICVLLQSLIKFDNPELQSFIAESVYEMASNSLNGRGPLLISLFLRVSGFESLVDASWCIFDEMSLIDSVFKIITSDAVVSELSFVFLVLSKCLTRCKKLYDSAEFKDLLSCLFKLSEQADSIDSRIILDLVHSLLLISFNCNPTIQASIVILLVEIGEIPHLEIANKSDLLNLNSCLRSSSPSTQLMVLKFLTAYAASHSNAHVLMECPELLKTIWLLHFPVEKEKLADSSNALDLDDLMDVDVEESSIPKVYEIDEVTTSATELCGLLQLSTFSMDVLSEIVLLETEKGEKELQVKNLIEHYVAALGASIQSSSDLERISGEFKRLLTNRTTPNGIVRLTRNVDRTKLDFTKQSRKSLLRSIFAASKRVVDNLHKELVTFCFDVGFTDVDEFNCEIMFSTALNIVECCSNQSSLETIYAQLQDCLTAVPTGNDLVKVYAVILLGRASSRVPSLTSSSSRIWELIDRIKESLNVPSEKVQKAVADTLVPLLRSQCEDKRISAITFGFTSRLREAKEDYGAMRGAAFGLAALIESCGTGLIRSHEIFSLLTGGLGRLTQKNSESAVCSVLAAIEIISIRCGITFEPYIAPLVPGVLEALGDSRQRVREDAEACADAMMAALSPLSVALILPPLLDMAGMDGCHPKYSWRAKLGAVTWLGSMACLAPKVLTPALPRIIPALIVALTDAHEKVHLAAHHALAVKYAAIIRSPEIKAALPAILRALSDPPRFASACLGDIIGTSFCHAVDGPSLALLEPLLARALRERGTGAMSEAKRRAILIIANLGSLMDPVELRPYLINLVPALRGVLGDAVPQVRSGSARALGVMMRLMHNNGLAQDCPVLVEIVPECFEIIFSSLSSVTSIDRAGAAQAIAQVTAGRGLEPLIKLVDEKIAPVLFNEKEKEKSSNSSGTSREALLHLCAALPSALAPAEIPKLYKSVFTNDRLFSILQATASEDEGVREISTKTIRSLLLRKALFVDLQASLEILLKGSADGRWRIRFTSFAILSDLLPVLSMSMSCEDANGSEICDTENRTVSFEMRSRLLSRLFFGRFDSNGPIRNAAFSLWKSIVTHPPRVILEILPVLVDDCVASLEIPAEEDYESESDDESDIENDSENDSDYDSESSSGEGEMTPLNVKVDRYEMASSALQDILVKLSDRVLLPFLRRLAQIFKTSSSSVGVLLAARIITSVILVPNLIPPHQRTVSSVPVVNVPRAQIDEALKIVLELTKQGLTDEFERTVSVSVALFAKISQGLSSSPVLFERIVSELFFDNQNSTEALISVLNRRPRILLGSLVNRFKKVEAGIVGINLSWWSEVLVAPGPFLAPHAPALITHSLKLTTIEESLPLFEGLLASMASYDPEILYGDEDEESYEDDDDEDLEDCVETGLFSFGQLLETLWSARNQPQLAATLIRLFTLQGCNGIERLYETWIDRLLVSSLSVDCGSGEVFSDALEGILEGAVSRDEAIQVISQLNQSIETRSIISKNISSKLSSGLLLVLIKSVTLPVISNVSLSNSDRFGACSLLKSVILGGGNLKRLAVPAVTALLGALIRCLSDRTDTSKTERLKAALLPILLFALEELPAIGKPFHPQLSRLALNILNDLVSLSGNSIDFEESHSRGQIALVTCKLVSILLTEMTRIDSLLVELAQFRVIESETENCLSTRNSRRVLLFILKSISSPSIQKQNLSIFIEETVKCFMTLPSSEIELIRETALTGLALSQKIENGQELKTFINNLI